MMVVVVVVVVTWKPTISRWLHRPAYAKTKMVHEMVFAYIGPGFREIV